MKALIVTGGLIEDDFTLEYIKKETYDVIFAVDRGLGFFYRTEIIPHFIVGDFDSIEEEVLQSFGTLHEKETAKIIRLNPMKDETDTEYALGMALDMGCDRIHLFGATGTRLDHVLGNIQLLGLALRQQAECVMLDSHNRIRLINKETILTKKDQFGKYISLIPYTPQVRGLTLEGFVYPLSDYTMSDFYLEGATPISGVSNEIAEETARIDMKDGILVLVESRD